MSPNDDASVRIEVIEVEDCATQKDIGLIVHSSLTWTSQAKFCCGKAVKAFHLIKGNIWFSAASYTRMNLYMGYLVPMLSYGEILWKASKTDSKLLRVYKKILRHCPMGCEERLQKNEATSCVALS